MKEGRRPGRKKEGRKEGRKEGGNRQANLQHQLLRECKHLLAGQRLRKTALPPGVHSTCTIIYIPHYARLQHILQLWPRRQRRRHQLVVQPRHGRRVQHRIMLVRPQELEQRHHRWARARIVNRHRLSQTTKVTVETLPAEQL